MDRGLKDLVADVATALIRDANAVHSLALSPTLNEVAASGLWGQCRMESSRPGISDEEIPANEQWSRPGSNR